MTGVVRCKYTGYHFLILVDNGGKYLNPVTLCGWKDPKHSTFTVDSVTCPDCLEKIRLQTQGK